MTAACKRTLKSSRGERRRGLTVDEIQILLGHSSVRTTADLYVHTRVEDVAEHMGLIEAEGR